MLFILIYPGRWEHPVFSRIRTSKVLLRPQETPERGVPGRRSASAKVLGRKRAWPLLELGRRDGHRDRSWNWWARWARAWTQRWSIFNTGYSREFPDFLSFFFLNFWCPTPCSNRINWSPVGLWKPVFFKVPQVIPVCSRDEEPLTRGLATSQRDRKVNDEEYRPRDRTIWLSIPFLPPSGCVIQGTLLKLSVPQFHHLKNGGSREPTL